MANAEKGNRVRTARLEAGLAVSRLAGLAGVAQDTVRKAERGIVIQELKAYAIMRVLNEHLPASKQVGIEDFEV
jgi:transcriptional regulator with XRE-family HTH domain